jgi:hypothetical protein
MSPYELNHTSSRHKWPKRVVMWSRDASFGQFGLAAFGVGVLVFALVLLGIAIADVPAESGELTGGLSSERQDAVTTSENGERQAKVCEHARPVALLVEVSSFDIQTARATLALKICGTLKSLSSLQSPAGHHLLHETEEPLSQTPGLSISIDKLAVTSGTPADQVRFIPSPGSTEGSTLRALSLSELAGGAERAVKLGTIVVLGFGSPGSYPFDSYGVVLEGALQLTSPAGKVLLPIPLTGLFKDGTAIQPLHAKAETLFSNGEYSATIALERPLPTKLYILLITFIPLILAVLLIVVIARRKGRDAFSFGALEIAGVGAVLLAILPARQVLVPPGADQLTFVDYILGCEMAMMVAFTCVAVAATMSRPRKKSASAVDAIEHTAPGPPSAGVKPDDE